MLRSSSVTSALRHRIDDIECYATVLQSCASTTNLSQLKRAHAQILKIGVSHHDFIRAKLVYSYATCKRMREAEYIFSITNRRSAFLYNTMIRCYASMNQFVESVNIYRQMLMVGKQPDRQTLPAVFKTCASMSALYIGCQVHVAVLVHGFSSDMAICNALIAMYSKCGDLIKARQLFDKMNDRNVITWSAMIAGYGIHGISSEVFKLFEEMLLKGVTPDGVTFTAVLTACSHSGLMNMGRRFFEMMKGRFGMKPGLEHYTCMVDMLGRAGHVEEAEALILGMEMEPDSTLWGALLGACKIHGKVEVQSGLQRNFMRVFDVTILSLKTKSSPVLAQKKVLALCLQALGGFRRLE